MTAEEMVDASLAGLDQGELITIPPLPNIGDWEKFEEARKALGPNLSPAFRGTLRDQRLIGSDRRSKPAFSIPAGRIPDFLRGAKHSRGCLYWGLSRSYGVRHLLGGFLPINPLRTP